MFALARKVVFGVLATSSLMATAHVASAKPWSKPYPWPNYYHVYHGPAVYINPAPVYYGVNPAPAEIQLVNPASNQVALRYTLNGGAVQLLPAGGAVAIQRESVIAFDRGGAQGWNRYSLSDGAYKFVPNNGAWDLVRDTPEASVGNTIAAAANPLPAK